MPLGFDQLSRRLPSSVSKKGHRIGDLTVGLQGEYRQGNQMTPFGLRNLGRAMTLAGENRYPSSLLL